MPQTPEQQPEVKSARRRWRVGLVLIAACVAVLVLWILGRSSPNASVTSPIGGGQVGTFDNNPPAGAGSPTATDRDPTPETSTVNDNTNLRGEDRTAIPVIWPQGQVPITDGRPGRAGDVAEVIAFLASDRARHVTGTPIWVDGGQGLLR